MVGNDDMPMDDDIDEQEDYILLSTFIFLCFRTCAAGFFVQMVCLMPPVKTHFFAILVHISCVL